MGVCLFLITGKSPVMFFAKTCNGHGLWEQLPIAAAGQAMDNSIHSLLQSAAGLDFGLGLSCLYSSPALIPVTFWLNA